MVNFTITQTLKNFPYISMLILYNHALKYIPLSHQSLSKYQFLPSKPSAITLFTRFTRPIFYECTLEEFI